LRRRPAPERKAAADINALIKEIRIKGRNEASIAIKAAAGKLAVHYLSLMVKGSKSLKGELKLRKNSI
jgi:hypothetical protein